jgi:hypothetical protein
VQRKREKIDGYSTMLEREYCKNCVMYCIGGGSLYRGEEGEQPLLGPMQGGGGEAVPPRVGA